MILASNHALSANTKGSAAPLYILKGHVLVRNEEEKDLAAEHTVNASVFELGYLTNKN